MTIANQSTRVSYNGNDVTTAFSFPHLFYKDSDLTVLIVKSDGAEILQILTTHYTVSGAGNPAGGTVTMLTAPATGDKLVILRELDLDQGTDFVENDALPVEEVEKGLDRAVMMVQQVQEQLNRTAKLPTGYTGAAVPTIPIPGAGKYLRWRADGLALEAADVEVVSGVVASAYMQTVLPAVDAGAARVALGIGGLYSSIGLRCWNEPSAPNTKFFMSADILQFRNDADGVVTIVPTPANVINDTALDHTVPNGRDQAGAFANSSWIWFYFVINSIGTISSRSSLTGPLAGGPALQGSEFAWVPAYPVFKDGSGNLRKVSCRGDRVHYDALQALSAITATSESSLNVSAFVPNDAMTYELDFNAWAVTIDGAGSVDVTLTIRQLAGLNYWAPISVNLTGLGASDLLKPFAGGCKDLVNVNTPPSFLYQWTVVKGSAQTATPNVSSYTVPNGAI